MYRLPAHFNGGSVIIVQYKPCISIVEYCSSILGKLTILLLAQVLFTEDNIFWSCLRNFAKLIKEVTTAQ